MFRIKVLFTIFLLFSNTFIYYFNKFLLLLRLIILNTTLLSHSILRVNIQIVQQNWILIQIYQTIASYAPFMFQSFNLLLIFYMQSKLEQEFRKVILNYTRKLVESDEMVIIAPKGTQHKTLSQCLEIKDMASVDKTFMFTALDAQTQDFKLLNGIKLGDTCIGKLLAYKLSKIVKKYRKKYKGDNILFYFRISEIILHAKQNGNRSLRLTGKFEVHQMQGTYQQQLQMYQTLLEHEKQQKKKIVEIDDDEAEFNKDKINKKNKYFLMDPEQLQDLQFQSKTQKKQRSRQKRKKKQQKYNIIGDTQRNYIDSQYRQNSEKVPHDDDNKMKIHKQYHYYQQSSKTDENQRQFYQKHERSQKERIKNRRSNQLVNFGRPPKNQRRKKSKKHKYLSQQEIEEDNDEITPNAYNCYQYKDILDRVKTIQQVQKFTRKESQ